MKVKLLRQFRVQSGETVLQNWKKKASREKPNCLQAAQVPYGRK